MILKQIEIGTATLVHGNCYDILSRFRGLGAVVTDPPYLFDSSGGGAFRKSRTYLNTIKSKRLDQGFDHGFLVPDFSQSVVCFCHERQIGTLKTWFDQHYDRVSLCLWCKTNPMPMANKSYQAECEFYIHAWQKNAFPLGSLAQKKRITNHAVGRSPFAHPTVKPDRLMDKIIANVNDDTIIDPFMGTGSTGVAAIKAGKKFIGIEIDETYFSIAHSRLLKAHEDMGLFAGGED